MSIPNLIRQKAYERVEYILRRHPITFLPILFLFLILLAAPVAVYFLIHAIYPALFGNEILFSLGVLLGSAYYLGIYLFFYAQFIEYYLDIWVVTNDRIIDVEQLGLFSKTISELDLFRIQDVTADVHGFFATIFNYGNLSVNTASANVGIIFRNISHPNEIRENLIRLSHEDRKHHYFTPGDEHD
ncbi:MAG: PH domain-containing protein [Patescibacteria group bacterium]